MLEIFLLAIGLVGFGLAGYWDIKSTEFPDWLPYSMIIVALVVRGVFAWLASDWSIITNSVVVGAGFLALGLAMYFLRQWGDGDAWLLGALGFLYPNASSLWLGETILPFPVVMLFNFFLVAFFYIIAYSLALSFTRPETYRGFVKSLKKDYKGAVLIIGGFSAAYFIFLAFMLFAFGFVPPSPIYVVALPLFIAFVVLFSRYGAYIEKNLFKRRIPVSRLRPGDVPVGGKWRVLKPKEVAALKKRGGAIWIKEGVRFAPAFFATVIATLLFGSIAALIFALA